MTRYLVVVNGIPASDLMELDYAKAEKLAFNSFHANRGHAKVVILRIYDGRAVVAREVKLGDRL